MGGPRKQRLIGLDLSPTTSDRRIVPILGTVPIGIGMMGFFVSCHDAKLLTLVTILHLCNRGFWFLCGERHCGSVIRAFRFLIITSRTFFRSLLGTFLPLAGPPLYNNLGLGYVSVLSKLMSDGVIQCSDLSPLLSFPFPSCYIGIPASSLIVDWADTENG